MGGLRDPGETGDAFYHKIILFSRYSTGLFDFLARDRGAGCSAFILDGVASICLF